MTIPLLSRLSSLCLTGLVQVYRYGISPFTPAACRYYPTCSAYALEALQTHGPLRGGLLSIRRLLRCHPWGHAGNDPVPPSSNARFSGADTDS